MFKVYKPLKISNTLTVKCGGKEIIFILAQKTMSINVCDLCYELTAVSCYGQLRLDIGQMANRVMTAFVEDKFGNFFAQGVLTDGIGSITLQMADFPEGMFNPYSGIYTVSISTSSLQSTYENMTIEGDNYNCIKVKFVDVN